jgi:hypothetical protein
MEPTVYTPCLSLAPLTSRTPAGDCERREVKKDEDPPAGPDATDD